MTHCFKLILLFAIICTAQQTGYAQNAKNETNYQIKVYYNFFHTPSEIIYGGSGAPQVLERSSTNFGVITPALTITKNRLRHEIELSAMRVKRDKDFESIQDAGSIIPVDGSRDWRVNIGLRYEFAYNLLREELRHGLFVGVSVEPYFDYWNSAPATSTEFRTDTKIFGTRLHLIPRYTYDIGKKWFLDINFPIEAMNMFAQRFYVANPILTESQRVGADLEIDFFDKIFRFRVGIGLKL